MSAANVPAGVQFGGNGEGAGGVEFVSAAPDLKHVVLAARVPLTSNSSVEGGLYEWSAGQLSLVSVLPDGTSTAASLGDRGELVRGAISVDGSRVVFQTASGDLYLRDTVRGETVKVDAAQGGSEPGVEQSQYATADSTGSRVFFLSSQRLTADSTASGEYGEYDLYAFEVTSGAGQPLAGRLRDLAVDRNAGETAAVQGVIGASEDGSSVYFVAHGVLGDGAEHGAQARGENLYLERYDQGTGGWTAPRFIAVLSEEDAPSWGSNPQSARLQNMTSRVSPNGRYLAFMSDRGLTGYDNRDASAGVPDEEVFLYDASSGRLACASCDPTGARPEGLFEGSLYEENLVDYAKTWGERWLAGNIPGWDSTDLSHGLYQPRYLSDSGRLFFNSSDSLVPGDVNGKEDVYEYEPDGIGSCQGEGHGQNADDVFAPGEGGCVALISSGTSAEESAFLDASETGGDVFFLTLTRLQPQDVDTSIDVYDAHECTTAAPCAPPAALVPPPCSTGDACKVAPTPQPAVFGAPASATFSGAGNVTPEGKTTPSVSKRSSGQAKKLAQALKACARKPKRGRAACRSRAKRRYGAKSSRSHGRAAGKRSPRTGR